MSTTTVVDQDLTRVALIAVATGGKRRDPESLDELDALARSAGLTPVHREIVHRPKPDPALFLGRGGAERIGEQLKAASIALVVFDHSISAVQQRNLTRLWSVRVADRTELIIDIFSQRARSTEGRLQVELARLRHQATRLVRMWSHLERQRGGIGVRGGPGETQLELDRRMLDDRIRRVRDRLAKVERQRRTRRRARQRGDALRVSLIGYTNAGKSTLFNRLTGSGAYAADQLFATLDPLTRRMVPEGRPAVLLSDTVGFVRDLPHGLVAAFRATLEETAEADLLLHVVDASAPDRDEQTAAVEQVLGEIGAADVPRLMVLNKVDRTTIAPGERLDAYGRIVGLALSAASGAGVDRLQQWLREKAGAGEMPTAFAVYGDPVDDEPVDGASVEDDPVDADQVDADQVDADQVDADQVDADQVGCDQTGAREDSAQCPAPDTEVRSVSRELGENPAGSPGSNPAVRDPESVQLVADDDTTRGASAAR